MSVIAVEMPPPVQDSAVANSKPSVLKGLTHMGGQFVDIGTTCGSL